jgi:hypothetical protein
LCHVFYADKAGATKHCSHFPIYGNNIPFLGILLCLCILFHLLVILNTDV